MYYKNNAGRTPVAVAREVGDTGMVKRLLAHTIYALLVTPQRKLASNEQV